MADEIKKPATAPDAASAPGVEVPAPEFTPVSAEAASLLGLIDKLNALLEKSELIELEVEAGQSSIVLRKPAALPSMTTTIAIQPRSRMVAWMRAILSKRTFNSTSSVGGVVRCRQHSPGGP